VQVVQLTSMLLPQAVEEMKGMRPGPADYDLLVKDDADVYKPDGSLLLRFRKGLLPPSLLKTAQKVLKDAAQSSRNRGAAAGYQDEPPEVWKERVGQGRGFRYRPIRKDGTLSKSSYAPPVMSGVVGYLDRTVRYPYCRLTTFGHEHPERLAAAMPLFVEISEAFRRLLPCRWEAQQQRVAATTPAFVFPNTVFSTVTVNRNFQTALHCDKGDLKEGFGVMTVMERPAYLGGYLVYPAYRVAVDVRHGDLLLSDVHEFHGNTAMTPLTASWERLALVLYYREKLGLCGSLDEELERAKRRQIGDPLDE
jgi:hypothetical protein